MRLLVSRDSAHVVSYGNSSDTCLISRMYIREHYINQLSKFVIRCHSLVVAVHMSQHGDDTDPHNTRVRIVAALAVHARRFDTNY
jgi:hypothetical protein